VCSTRGAHRRVGAGRRTRVRHNRRVRAPRELPRRSGPDSARQSRSPTPPARKGFFFVGPRSRTDRHPAGWSQGSRRHALWIPAREHGEPRHLEMIATVPKATAPSATVASSPGA